MVAPLTEVDVLGGGLETGLPRGGVYVQNMLRWQGAWQIRKGFGQVAQLDTALYYDILGESPTTMGFYRVLGARLLHTTFGHDQIVMLILNRAVTPSNTDSDTYYPCRYLVSVRIFDLSTNSHWEEVIPRFTAEGVATTVPIDARHGVGSSTSSDMRSQWEQGQDEEVSWAEIGDDLYFATKSLGVFVYRPATFSSSTAGLRTTHRTPQVDIFQTRTQQSGYEEPCIIARVYPSTGPDSAGYGYRDEADLPKPNAITSFGSRLVYCGDRTVYFSDEGWPAAHNQLNFVEVPTREKIVAAHEVLGALIIWTSTETWAYTPPQGGLLLTGGRLDRLSDSVGCVGPGAVTKVDDAAVWVDKNGLFGSNGTSIENVSLPISGFWNQGITSPLQSFYTDDGKAILTNDQPKLTHRFVAARAHVAYCPKYGALILGVPGDNVALVRTDGQWAVWTTETQAVSATAVKKGLKIEGGILLANERDIYLVGGPMYSLVDNRTLTAGTSAEGDFPNNAVIVCRYGRGGGIERSASGEDQRYLTGRWTGEENGCEFRIGKPIFASTTGYQIIDPILGGGNIAPRMGSVFVPVSIVPGKAWDAVKESGVNAFSLSFKYDNENWFVLQNPNGTLLMLFPPERSASKAGYTVRSVSTGGAGNTITIAFDDGLIGGAAQTVWLNAPMQTETLLFYLVFVPGGSFGAYTSRTLSGLGIEAVSATATDDNRGGAPIVYTAGLRWWKFGRVGTADLPQDTGVAQPVDWCYMSAPLFAEEGSRIRVRGIYVDARSHGVGTGTVFGDLSALGGLLQTTLSVDGLEEAAQRHDLQGVAQTQGDDDHDPTFGTETLAAIRTKVHRTTIRPTVRDNQTYEGQPYYNFLPKVFNGGLVYDYVPAPPATYPVDKTMEIGGQENIVSSISDSVKGAWCRVMLWGHVLDRAEELVFASCKVAVQGRLARRRASERTNDGTVKPVAMPDVEI